MEPFIIVLAGLGVVAVEHGRLTILISIVLRGGTVTTVMWRLDKWTRVIPAGRRG